MLGFRRPAPGTVLGGLAVIVATTGVAVGSIPSSVNSTITACYEREAGLADNRKGTLRVIDPEAGQSCDANKDNTLRWKDGSTLLGRTETAVNADKLDRAVDTTTRGRGLVAHSFTGAVAYTTGCPEDGLTVRGGWNILITNAEVSESYGRSTYTLVLTAPQDQQARHSGGGIFVTCIVADRPISVTG